MGDGDRRVEEEPVAVLREPVVELGVLADVDGVVVTVRLEDRGVVDDVTRRDRADRPYLVDRVRLRRPARPEDGPLEAADQLGERRVVGERSVRAADADDALVLPRRESVDVGGEPRRRDRTVRVGEGDVLAGCEVDAVVPAGTDGAAVDDVERRIVLRDDGFGAVAAPAVDDDDLVSVAGVRLRGKRGERLADRRARSCR
ncbi:MAG: hypothetical protein U5K28_05260 [Halobacteriales archaeon]|nr:hypothetical protein [Halobacteriales archaeon]